MRCWEGVYELQTGGWLKTEDIKGVTEKRMILAEIIDRVEIGAGYKNNIEFKLTARQFPEPDAEAAGD